MLAVGRTTRYREAVSWKHNIRRPTLLGHEYWLARGSRCLNVLINKSIQRKSVASIKCEDVMAGLASFPCKKRAGKMAQGHNRQLMVIALSRVGLSKSRRLLEGDRHACNLSAQISKHNLGVIRPIARTSVIARSSCPLKDYRAAELAS